MTDFNKILEKAKEIELKVKESQEKIKNIKAEGSSGGGQVKIVFNGDGEIESLKISEWLMGPKAVIFYVNFQFFQRLLLWNF